METVTTRATTPMVSHVRWRMKRLHEEPSSLSDCTEEAERTITTPVTSRMVTTAPRRTKVVRPAAAAGPLGRRLGRPGAVPLAPAFGFGFGFGFDFAAVAIRLTPAPARRSRPG